MKAREIGDGDRWHKLARIEVQPVKFFLSASVVILLVVAWVLTGPFFQWHDRLVERLHQK